MFRALRVSRSRRVANPVFRRRGLRKRQNNPLAMRQLQPARQRQCQHHVHAGCYVPQALSPRPAQQDQPLPEVTPSPRETSLPPTEGGQPWLRHWRRSRPRRRLGLLRRSRPVPLQVQLFSCRRGDADRTGVATEGDSLAIWRSPQRC